MDFKQLDLDGLLDQEHFSFSVTLQQLTHLSSAPWWSQFSHASWSRRRGSSAGAGGWISWNIWLQYLKLRELSETPIHPQHRQWKVQFKCLCYERTVWNVLHVSETTSPDWQMQHRGTMCCWCGHCIWGRRFLSILNITRSLCLGNWIRSIEPWGQAVLPPNKGAKTDPLALF